MVDRALRLARRAAVAASGSSNESLFQLTLGLAAFRAGGLEEQAAEALDRALETVGKLEDSQARFRRPVQASSKIVKAMVWFQSGKRSDALALLSEAEATIETLPLDDRQILELVPAIDTLMVLIPYKEAKALLQ
jgi:hypothetical protein